MAHLRWSGCSKGSKTLSSWTQGSNYMAFWLTIITQILTQEDWNVVLFNGMEKTSHWAALYFVTLMTFGNYVLFNLLVAILVEGFSAEVSPNLLLAIFSQLSKHTHTHSHTHTLNWHDQVNTNPISVTNQTAQSRQITRVAVFGHTISVAIVLLVFVLSVNIILMIDSIQFRSARSSFWRLNWVVYDWWEWKSIVIFKWWNRWSSIVKLIPSDCVGYWFTSLRHCLSIITWLNEIGLAFFFWLFILGRMIWENTFRIYINISNRHKCMLLAYVPHYFDSPTA